MAILVTNDDGIDAPGLDALLASLAGLDDLYVAAPMENQSGVGMGITLGRSLGVRELPDGPGGVVRRAVGGTPADCAMYGLTHLLDGKPPRLLVSGINLGANLGQNVMCSGTVAAAFTALLAGVPAVAVSRGWTETPDWTGSRHYARVVVEKALDLIGTDYPAPFLLNLNVPDLPAAEIRGLAVARHGLGGYKDGLGLNPDGETYSHVGGWIHSPPPPEGDCENSAYLAGYAVVTPMRFDMTDTRLLAHLQETWN